MNFRTFMILLIIFITLGTYVWFFERNGTTGPESTRQHEKLLDFSPDDVCQIILARQDQRIIFTRKENQWMLTEPTPAKARNEMVEGLLSLFDLGIVQEISTDITDESKYGLDRPEIRFELRFKNAPPQALLIGNNAPGFGACYARLENQSRVVLLGILYKTDLNRDLKIFID